MTANLVTGFSPMQDLIPQTATNQSQTSTADFSDVLKANTSKTAEVDNSKLGDNDKPADTVKPKTKDQSKLSETKPVCETNKSEDTAKMEDTSEAEETAAVKDALTDDNGEVNEEVMEAVAEIVASMVTTIAEVLEVPVAEVESAIETLGLAKEEVLDSTVIPKLAVELTDATDVSEIITDEELFADVKSLMETSDKLVADLATELDMPVDELKGIIETKVAEIKAPVAEETLAPMGKDSATDVNPAPQVAYVPEMSTEAPKNESRQGSSNRENNRQDAKANDNVSYTQSVVENIRESVQEIANEVPLSYTSGTSMEEILDQVSNNLKMTMKDDMTEMEMQLHPASLGNIKVQVIARDGVITANFTTQNEQVRQALEAQVVQLKEQMNEQGIKVEAVEVTVSSHAFERNLNEEGERGQSQGEAEAKRRRTRGINLGDMDDLDEMDEEDKVTADMMARAGNTVDYLA